MNQIDQVDKMIRLRNFQKMAFETEIKINNWQGDPNISQEAIDEETESLKNLKNKIKRMSEKL